MYGYDDSQRIAQSKRGISHQPSDRPSRSLTPVPALALGFAVLALVWLGAGLCPSTSVPIVAVGCLSVSVHVKRVHRCAVVGGLGGSKTEHRDSKPHAREGNRKTHSG